MFFYLFMALFVIILNFLWWNLSKCPQHIASCGIRILNTKKKGLFTKQVFRLFANLCLSPLRKKTGLIDFREKQAPTKVKRLLPVCQVSQNFTKGNTIEFTVSFAFCAHADVIKSRKTLMRSFERTQITWAFVLSACAIIKLL